MYWQVKSPTKGDGLSQETAVASERITVETGALLFDMDGVLLSSIGSVVRCWREWCRIYNIPNADTYEVPHGTRAEDVIKQLRPDIDSKEGLKVIEDLEVRDMEGLHVFPGVKSLLESMPLSNWAIVTSATMPLLTARLKQAGLPVPSNLVSAESVEKGKPAPDPYLEGARLLGFKPQDCIVVEDAPAGVRAGLEAGCRVLAVLNTHPVEELPGATWYTPSLENVRAVVQEGGLKLEFDSVSE